MIFESDLRLDDLAVEACEEEGTPKNPEILYCETCGKYLGDVINGHLWKFGKLVMEVHICKR